MADENPTAPNAAQGRKCWQDEAGKDEALVLDRLLSHWPTHLQESDLQRELALGDDDFEHRDRVDRALMQLNGAGLATRCAGLAIPTRAALYYRQLSELDVADL